MTRSPVSDSAPEQERDVAVAAGVASLELKTAASRFPPEVLPEHRAQAWALQQAAFSLPPEGPPAHPGHTEQLRVVVEEDRVVSCLTLIEAALVIRGTRVPMGGVRHVATHPEEQNRGFASALVRSTLQGMCAQRLPVSVLFPFSFRYYRKFGYELGGNSCQFWCRPSSIPAYQERGDCRPATPEDCERLADLHAAHLRHSLCGMDRSRERWSALCVDPRYQTVVHTDGGYAVLEETRDPYGGRLLRVLELCARTPAGWRGLLGHLSQATAESVEWLGSAASLAESGLLRSTAPLREGFKPRGIATLRPQFQVRITDLSRLLEALAPGFPSGKYRLALRVRDELIPENARPVAIQGHAAQAEIRPARATDPALELDIRIAAQILCGYMSPLEAVSQGLARASSPAALETAEALFPAGDPFLSELDRF